MSKVVTIFRWILGVFLGLFLMVFMALGLTLSAVSRIATDSQSIKSWFKDAEIYQEAPRAFSILIEEQMESSEEGEGKLPIEKEELSQVTGGVVTPQWLQNNVEIIIDSVYVWLDGETEIPRFEIDLNDRMDILVAEIKNLFSQRLDELPECTSQQEQNISQEEFNPFEEECQPSFFTEDALDQLDDKMREEISKKLEENEMVKEGVLYSEDLIEMKSEDVEKIQLLYSHAKKLILYISGLVLLISLIILLLIPGMGNKLIVLGTIWLLSSASVLLGLPVGKTQFYSAYNQEIQNIDVEAQGKIIDLMGNLVDVVLSDVINQIQQYSVVILVVGFIILVGGIFLKIGKRGEEIAKV